MNKLRLKSVYRVDQLSISKVIGVDYPAKGGVNNRENIDALINDSIVAHNLMDVNRNDIQTPLEKRLETTVKILLETVKELRFQKDLSEERIKILKSIWRAQ